MFMVKKETFEKIFRTELAKCRCAVIFHENTKEN